MLYPIGIQSFSEIRNSGYVYVDKTALIYSLTSTGKYYFLSRPRRFGKSLLVSTMEAYFRGRKELFKGLALENLETDWLEYPVLHLDLTGSRYTSVDDLRENLAFHLSGWERTYGKDDEFTEPAARFKAVIDAAYRKTGRKVVILIDEYDKPIVDNIDAPELMEAFRRELQGFYSVIKGKDEFIRFAFLTGVTKLGKMSIFSGLNNLNDISMDLGFSDICGVSEEELKEYFDGSVTELAEACRMSREECYSKLKTMYDGYHFSEGAAGIYNPFSLLNTFKANRFRMYWFETGTPTFLVRYFERGRYNLASICKEKVSKATLTYVNHESPSLLTQMFQTGCLTISGYDNGLKTYNLDYPNKEVEYGFVNFLCQFYAQGLINGKFSISNFVRDIERGDVQGFMDRFTSFLSDNSYEIQGDLELYFQNTMSVMLKMMGLYVKTEYRTSNGRIDIVFDTDKYVYIIELKRDLSPEEALRQIEAKGYDKPFLSSGKEIIKLGINFSSESRTIDGWKADRS